MGKDTNHGLTQSKRMIFDEFLLYDKNAKAPANHLVIHCGKARGL